MPIKLKDLYKICATPDINFLHYLQEIKFINSEQFCQKCKGKMKLALHSSSIDRYRWRCQKRGKIDPHDVCCSVRSGSWFESSQITISDIALMTYMWVNQFSIAQVSYELNIVSAHTLGDWFKFYRDVCEAILLKKSHRIGGPEKIVEINAYKIEKKKSKRRKLAELYCVFGGVERESDKCFFVAVQDCSALTFLQVIKNNVLPGSVIYTNLSENNCLETEEFQNVNLCFSLKFGDSGTNTNKCKAVWGQVKRKFPAGKWDVRFSSYLSEYVYRKTLENAEDKFLTFVADIASVFYESNKPESVANAP